MSATYALQVSGIRTVTVYIDRKLHKSPVYGLRRSDTEAVTAFGSLARLYAWRLANRPRTGEG
jgi:hypothetical protein